MIYGNVSHEVEDTHNHFESRKHTQSLSTRKESEAATQLNNSADDRIFGAPKLVLIIERLFFMWLCCDSTREGVCQSLFGRLEGVGL